VNLRAAIAVLAVGILAASASPLRPSPPQHAAPKKLAVARIACGSGASLSINASSASQGGLLLAGLSTKSSLTSVHAKWDSQEISFWQSGPSSASPAKPQIWRALVPVDLEKAAGDYDLSVDVQPEQGQPAACQLTIRVTPGKFATESLKVAPQFVEPNPEQLQRAKTEQQRLREIYATVTPDKLWQGPFRVPLAGVTSGANFGRRRVLNGQPSSPHTGVDFPAPTGTPVRAAQAGRVVLAEPLYFAGNTVLIDHGLGIYTLYGHLSVISVKAGDKLRAGALLGKVGATGRVTGPHLHWGLIVTGARVNALQIINFPAL
jgi:murein DD-endopeptidase MepM/ murein hydrolase activator NlpD